MRRSGQAAGGTGVFGGSFSPIHYAHLWSAQYVLEEMGLDEIVFVPAGEHAFKGTLLAAHHRVEMIRRAIRGMKFFRLSTIEVERPGPSYTYETLKTLQAESPDKPLYFIIGGDNLAEMVDWYRSEDLLREFPLVVVGRGPDDGAALEDVLRRHPVLSRYRGQIRLIEAPFAYALNSSFIRKRVREGKSITYLVPPAVEQYIAAHRLYVDGCR